MNLPRLTAPKTERHTIENSLCASLSWAQIEAAARDATDLRALFERIAQRGFNCVSVPLFVASPHSWATTRAVLRACRECALPVTLRLESAPIEYSKSGENAGNTPDGGAPYLKYAMTDARAGFQPNFDSATLALTVVPKGADDELSWPQARTDTDSHDVPPLQNDARLYAWQVAHDATRIYDPLDARAVAVIVSSTRNAWKSLDADLRAIIHGVSVEVPRLWDADAPDAARRFPWSGELAARFQRAHGYDLAENLSSLVADTGRNAVRVRQDFWQSVADSLRDNFGRAWEKWARESDVRLQWRLRAAPLNRLVACYGALAPLMEAHDVVVEIERDLETGDAKNSANTVLVRFLSSLAATKTGEKRPRVSVAFGNDSPPLFEWHRFLLAGATAFESAWREKENRRDALLHPYVARQIASLRDGRSGARVGVLWPLRSGWAHHHPKGHRFVRWVEEDLADVADWLDDLRFDWLFLTEDAICNAPLEDRTSEDRVLDVASNASAPNGVALKDVASSGIKSNGVASNGVASNGVASNGVSSNARATPVLRCGEIGIEVVVLPSVTCLSRAAWARLEEFALRGGKIVCLGLLPRWSEIGRDEELERRVETQTRGTLEDVYQSYRREGRAPSDAEMLAPSSVGYPILRQTARGGRISTYQPRLNLDRDDARLRVRPIFSESLAPELESQNRGLRYTRRCTPHENLFWLWNTGDETAKINLLLHAGNIARLDERDGWNSSRATSSTGIALWMPLTGLEGGGAALSFEMASGETRVVVASNENSDGEQPHGESANFVVEDFDGKVARGYIKQSGAPMIAVRQNGKLSWSSSVPVIVPSPILLDDWQADEAFDKENSAHIEYSISFEMPLAWRDCVVRLEVAASQQSERVVAAFADGQLLGERFAPPLAFTVPLQSEDETRALDLKLRVETFDERDEAPLARLVAYPRVEIAVQGREEHE